MRVEAKAKKKKKKYATQYYLDTSGAQLIRAKLNAAYGRSDKTRRNKTS